MHSHLLVLSCCGSCIYEQREDSEEVLQKKCAVLAGYIRRAKRAVVYTGAGISTVSNRLHSQYSSGVDARACIVQG